MNFDAKQFDADVRDALTLLEVHGLYPAQFFVRKKTTDDIKSNLSAQGFTEEELKNPMCIAGIPCLAFVETKH